MTKIVKISQVVHLICKKIADNLVDNNCRISKANHTKIPQKPSKTKRKIDFKKNLKNKKISDNRMIIRDFIR